MGTVAASASMNSALPGLICDNGNSADFCVSMGAWNCPAALKPYALKVSLANLFVVARSYR